jgi:hypothetical protein
VVACEAGFNTQIAEKEMPCIIYDPRMPVMTRSNKKRVNTEQGLIDAIKEISSRHQAYTELADILMIVANTENKHA